MLLNQVIGTIPHSLGGTYNELRTKIRSFILQPQFGEYYTKDIVYQDGMIKHQCSTLLFSHHYVGSITKTPRFRLSVPLKIIKQCFDAESLQKVSKTFFYSCKPAMCKRMDFESCMFVYNALNLNSLRSFFLHIRFLSTL